MGLFGKLFKGAGKLLGGVARAGLSVATHGASDKLLSAFKGLGRAKAAGTPKRDVLSTQQQALINKVAEPLAPRVKQTALYDSSMAGNAQLGSYGPRKRSAYNRRRPADYEYEPAPAPRRAAAPRTRQKAAGAKRALSPAMQVRANRMKALAATWRSLGGRDGTGQSFFDWKRGK